MDGQHVDGYQEFSHGDELIRVACQGHLLMIKILMHIRNQIHQLTALGHDLLRHIHPGNSAQGLDKTIRGLEAEGHVQHLARHLVQFVQLTSRISGTPLAKGKGSVFEGGFRVPCLVRWPGKIPAGKISNEIMSMQDWVPTLLAAVGEPDIKEKLKKGHTIEGKEYKVHLDGYDQTALLKGEGPGKRKEIAEKKAHKFVRVLYILLDRLITF